MDKPRIFLGSSGKQEKLLQALTRGLEDVAHVEPWTTSFNPGTTTWSASSSSRMKSTSPRSRSLRTTGRPTTRPHLVPRDPARLHRETTSSSKPASSVEPLGCAESSFFMRMARNSPAISSASRASGTAMRRTPPR